MVMSHNVIRYGQACYTVNSLDLVVFVFIRRGIYFILRHIYHIHFHDGIVTDLFIRQSKQSAEAGKEPALMWARNLAKT